MPFIENARQQGDGLELLRGLTERSAAAVFCDGQYRQGLDRLNYGNEGQRQRGRAALPQMTDKTMRAFVAEAIRVLRPSGHLFLWIDKYALWEASWRKWLPEVCPARLVDGMVWDKMRFGMGKRTRCQYEALAILQKGPFRAQGVWTDHSLGDVWQQEQERNLHPHAKPLDLIKRLMLATTERGDLVVDPAAGSFVVLQACLATGRRFMGCDLNG